MTTLHPVHQKHTDIFLRFSSLLLVRVKSFSSFHPELALTDQPVYHPHRVEERVVRVVLMPTCTREEKTGLDSFCKCVKCRWKVEEVNLCLSRAWYIIHHFVSRPLLIACSMNHLVSWITLLVGEILLHIIPGLQEKPTLHTLMLIIHYRWYPSPRIAISNCLTHQVLNKSNM